MGRDDLYITAPSFFRCPISLDVMESPVSLCTGVTYDRSSIQRWLDGGNNTCPATMQVLHSKDFVPNHTLERLIRIWSNSSRTRPDSEFRFSSLTPSQVLSLVDEISDTDSPETHLQCLLKVLCFASESAGNTKFLAENNGFVLMLIEKMTHNVLTNFESVEAAVKILHLILKSQCDRGKLQTLFLKTGKYDSISAMARIWKHGRSDMRVAIATIIEAIASDGESKIAVLENEELLSELLKGLNSDAESHEIDASLSCLISISTPKRNKMKIVRAGAVEQLGRLLARPNCNAESSLKLLEMLSGCSEGRMAISEDPNCVTRVVQKLLKVSNNANQHAVALIWSLCYLFRDDRASETVVKSNGLTKLLLMMQSNCSPAVKQMCGDLLRAFRVNSKSCLSSYDTKTTHIMPF
ncbi:hypothetical protein Nepgr_026341 [Nepenthes gracilis]|uniref:U-box domain-containing protein n=1 Tax=Nepenthes gracilis TaxID=150966 RepID=A0AAD3T6N7_NEPGR|nr:hypothetical protein Nepgr_026341 [Nepenthes gracilis]